MRLIDAEYLLYGMGMFSERENGAEFMKGAEAVAKMIEEAETVHEPDDWTPCAEGMPTETDKYWVTVFYYGELFVEDRDYFAHEKYWGQGLNPVAWMPKFKPEPYRADDTTGKVKEDEFMREAMYDQLHSNGN